MLNSLGDHDGLLRLSVRYLLKNKAALRFGKTIVNLSNLRLLLIMSSASSLRKGFTLVVVYYR